MFSARGTLSAVLRSRPKVLLSRSQSTVVGSTSSANTKTQAWKEFWPPKEENYTAAEKESMPWLSFKYDAKKSGEEKPWKKWVLDGKGGIVRRGSQ